MPHNRTYLIHNTPDILEIYNYECPYTESTIEYLRYKNIYEFDRLLYYTVKLLELGHIIVHDKKRIKYRKDDIENVDHMVNELENILNLYKHDNDVKYYKYDFTYPFRYKMIIKDGYNTFRKDNFLKHFLNFKEKIDKKRKEVDNNNIGTINKWVYRKTSLKTQKKNLYKPSCIMFRNI